MLSTFGDVTVKLRLWMLLSSLWWTVGAGFAVAHEVVPTVADLSVNEGRINIEMRINIEAQLSGINLDTLSNTDAAENVSDYDVLRALPGDEVAARAVDLVARWDALPLLMADGNAVKLRLVDVSMAEQNNLELPRLSGLTLQADLPVGGRTLELTWPTGAGSLVLRQQGVENAYTGLIGGGGTTGPISLAGGDAATGWQTFGSYIPVGFDHILPQGLDHILFVLGLFFLSTQLGPLLWQVSAFTLAHTVTLALGALGLVTISGSIVEPLIAASIVYVAFENILARGLTRWRPFVVFGFGLLHGLGFASVLGEFGLPEAQFIPALIGFNVGVESWPTNCDRTGSDHFMAWMLHSI